MSGKVNKAIRRRAELKTEGYKPVKYNTYRKKIDEDNPGLPRPLMVRVHPKSTKSIVKLIKEAARYFDKNGKYILQKSQSKAVSRMRKRKSRGSNSSND